MLLVFMAVAAAGFWAGATAFRPPDDPLSMAPEPIIHVVSEGTVGRSLRFTAVAEWALIPLGEMAGGGVITSVELEAGTLITAGDVVMTVNLHPVIVADGEIPMFRRLEMEKSGGDVSQLQLLLAHLGLFSGEVDGVFDASTRTAVMDWQETLGVDRTGIVEPGHIIFVPGLPMRAILDSRATVGVRLVDGASVLLGVPAAPDFWIPLAPDQSQAVPLASTVLVSYASGVWEAQTVLAEDRPDLGQLHLRLVAPDGGPVCGSMCPDWVPLGTRAFFAAEVVVVPRTTGPVVPAAALHVDAANRPHLRLEDGSLVEVSVVESGSGLVVVEGIEVGTRILLPVSAR